MSKRLNNPFNSLQTLTTQDGRRGHFYSLPALEAAGLGDIKRLPVSIRMVLESVLRSCDGKRITEDEVKTLASWNAKSLRSMKYHLLYRVLFFRISQAFRSS